MITRKAVPCSLPLIYFQGVIVRGKHMAKSKPTKPSKTPTNKDKGLPESVQWLLDFANLSCKSGVFLPKRFHVEKM